MGDLYDLIERLSNLIRSEERALGQELGLQPVHLHVLRYLRRCNRFSDNPAAITEYLGQTKGTVSQSLRLLESKGLLERRPDPGDKRIVHLSLTAAGRRATDRLLPPPSLKNAPLELETALRFQLLHMLDARGGRAFGVCRACRFHEPRGQGAHCRLLGEDLRVADASKICREYEASS